MKNVIDIRFILCFDFLFNVYPEVFSIREEFNEIRVLSYKYLGIQVKFRYFCPI